MRKFGCAAGELLGNSRLENIPLIREAGFDAVSLAVEYDRLNVQPELAEAKRCGLAVESLHAPSAGIDCMWTEEKEGDWYTERVRRVIQTAAEHGVPFVILHTVSGLHAPLTSNMALTRFGKLVVEAEKYHVGLALENCVYLRHMALLFSTFGSRNLGFCYDAGHQHVMSPGLDCMKLFGDRLFCVELHDNSGMAPGCTPDEADDLHRLPFDGKIDFAAEAEKLRSVRFDGTLMIEADNRDGFYDGMTAGDYYRRAIEAARKFAAMTGED